jgi:hypothetical protein
MKKVFLVLVGMMMLGACAGMPTTALQVGEQAKVTTNSQNSKIINFSKIDYSKIDDTKRLQKLKEYFLKAIVLNNNKATYTLICSAVGYKPIEMKNVMNNDGVEFKNHIIGEDTGEDIWRMSAYSKKIYMTDFEIEISETYLNAHKNGFDFNVNMTNPADNISFSVPAYYIQGVLDTVKKVKAQK